jgi:hypothetical protein
MAQRCHSNTNDRSMTEPYPSWSTIYFGSQYSLTTWDTGLGGVFYLQDINHPYETNAFLTPTEWGDHLLPPSPRVLLALACPHSR